MTYKNKREETKQKFPILCFFTNRLIALILFSQSTRLAHKRLTIPGEKISHLSHVDNAHLVLRTFRFLHGVKPTRRD